MPAPTTQPSNKKKTAILVVVTLATLVLGAIAVVTAMRLRQLATTPVAPTAPQSQPQAAIEPPNFWVCMEGFNVPTSVCQGWCDDDSDCGSGLVCIDTDDGSACYSTACYYSEQNEACECPAAEITCQSKTAYLDVENYVPGTFNVSQMVELTDNDTVSPGDVIVYEVTLNSTDTSGAARVTDVLPPEVALLETDANCTEGTDANQVVCDYSGPIPASMYYRVQVVDEVPAETEFTNEVYLDDILEACNATLATPPEEVTPSPTPPADATPTPTPPADATPTPTPTLTPTPPPDATPTPTSPPDATPTPTTPPAATATPVPQAVCGDTCVSASDCGSGLTCSSGVCRNPSCTTEADCVCDGVPGPTATPVPPPPSLPTAGVTLPTFMLIAVGSIILLAGIAGWLVW